MSFKKRLDVTTPKDVPGRTFELDALVHDFPPVEIVHAEQGSCCHERPRSDLVSFEFHPFLVNKLRQYGIER